MSARSNQDDRWTVGAVFLTALAVRLAFGFIVYPLILQHRASWAWTAYNDGYDLIAQHLLAGRGFSLDGTHPTAQRLPLYPLLLATHRLIPGAAEHIQQVMIVSHSLLQALTAALLYLFVTEHLNGARRAGLAAAGLMAIFPDSLYFIPRCFTENVFYFLVVAYVHLQARSLGPAGLRWAVAAGLCLGLGLLTRGTLLYLPLFLLAALAVGWRWLPRVRALAAPVAVSCAIAGLLLVPWGLRNQALSGHFFVSVTNSGIALFRGTQMTIHMPQIVRHLVLPGPGDLRSWDELEVLAHGAPPVGPDAQSGIANEQRTDQRFGQAAARLMRDHWPRLLVGYVCNTVSCMFLTHNRLYALGELAFNLPCAILGIVGLARVWRSRPVRQPATLLATLVVAYLYSLALVYPLSRYFTPVLPLLFAFVPFALPIGQETEPAGGETPPAGWRRSC